MKSFSQVKDLGLLCLLVLIYVAVEMDLFGRPYYSPALRSLANRVEARSIVQGMFKTIVFDTLLLHMITFWFHGLALLAIEHYLPKMSLRFKVQPNAEPYSMDKFLTLIKQCLFNQLVVSVSLSCALYQTFSTRCSLQAAQTPSVQIILRDICVFIFVEEGILPNLYYQICLSVYVKCFECLISDAC